MNALEYIKKLYNGKNCYSDHMGENELNVLHIESNVEKMIENYLSQKKVVFVTGNPGDGKTFLIKSIAKPSDVYTETDLNNVGNYSEVATQVIQCLASSRPAIVAANEYPFMLLLKEIRHQDPQLYDEIVNVRDSAIVYSNSLARPERVVVVDLNNRNLLDKDRHLPELIIAKMCDLLRGEENLSETLKYNIKALDDSFVRGQVISLFNLVTLGNEHYAMRDIMGAFAYMLTACEFEETQNMPYYTALFSGANILLQAIQKYDPVNLTIPSLDEQLWNGEIKDRWTLGASDLFPSDERFNDDSESAIELFRQLKRKYYFENLGGADLYDLQPSDILKYDLFNVFESKRKQIKETIIRSINKLTVPSDSNRSQLQIWTTHHFNRSLDTDVWVSSSFVDARDLELYMPRPATWLSGMEFIPNHLILKYRRTEKDSECPSLYLDMDFLRVLESVDEGYPVSLLPPQYLQSVNTFLQQLANNNLPEEYGDGEFKVASHSSNYARTILIINDKYTFTEED